MHTCELPAQITGKEVGQWHYLESIGHRLRAQWGTAARLARWAPNLLKALQWLPLGSSAQSPKSQGAHACPSLWALNQASRPFTTHTYYRSLHAPHSHSAAPLQILSFLSNMSFFYSISLSASLSSSHVLWEAFVNSFGWLRDNFSTVTGVFIQFNQ